MNIIYTRAAGNLWSFTSYLWVFVTDCFAAAMININSSPMVILQGRAYHNVIVPVQVQVLHCSNRSPEACTAGLVLKNFAGVLFQCWAARLLYGFKTHLIFKLCLWKNRFRVCEFPPAFQQCRLLRAPVQKTNGWIKQNNYKLFLVITCIVETAIIQL